jgi:hypothetical protein
MTLPRVTFLAYPESRTEFKKANKSRLFDPTQSHVEKFAAFTDLRTVRNCAPYLDSRDSDHSEHGIRNARMESKTVLLAGFNESAAEGASGSLHRARSRGVRRLLRGRPDTGAMRL